MQQEITSGRDHLPAKKGGRNSRRSPKLPRQLCFPLILEKIDFSMTFKESKKARKHILQANNWVEIEAKRISVWFIARIGRMGSDFRLRLSEVKRMPCANKCDRRQSWTLRWKLFRKLPNYTWPVSFKTCICVSYIDAAYILYGLRCSLTKQGCQSLQETSVSVTRCPAMNQAIVILINHSSQVHRRKPSKQILPDSDSAVTDRYVREYQWLSKMCTFVGPQWLHY